MIKIVLIGGGNLAWHLAHVFSKTKGVKLLQVYNRTLEAIKEFEIFTPITDNPNAICDSDVIILCVSDQAIQDVSNALNSNALVVHTSGSTDIKTLGNHKRAGVFYPLQSFTKNRISNFNEIPICVEAMNEKDLNLLKILANKISKKVIEISSNQRKKIHLAAVLVNNFTNHLYYLGYNYLEENHIDPQILKPLIKETALKIDTISPLSAQTGPAKRQDISIMNEHLKMLENSNTKEIYKLLSQSIFNTYEKKL